MIRIFISILIFMLVFSSGSPPSPVLAAPTSESVTWFMDVANPKTIVCVGETVEYRATAHYRSDHFQADWAIPGVNIEASSTDTNVGSFSVDRQIAGMANEDLVTASFFFKGKKPGTATLNFEALIDQIFTNTYVSFSVPVKVIPCKFKVVTTSNMAACYPGGCIKFLGVIIDGMLKADENGYFTGEAPVVWLSTSAVPNCGAVNSLGIGKVKMRGNLNDSSQLTVDLKYDPVSFSDVVTCPMGSGAGNLKITASAINVTVPTATGGVVRKPQQMQGGPGSAGGSALVYVIPMDAAN
jgi:hypothetical protein